MNQINKYLVPSELPKIKYVTRGFNGNWSLSYFKRTTETGSIESSSVNSWEQISDDELNAIRKMGLKVFDFHKVSPEEFKSSAKEMEAYMHW